MMGYLQPEDIVGVSPKDHELRHAEVGQFEPRNGLFANLTWLDLVRPG